MTAPPNFPSAKVRAQRRLIQRDLARADCVVAELRVFVPDDDEEPNSLADDEPIVATLIAALPMRTVAARAGRSVITYGRVRWVSRARRLRTRLREWWHDRSILLEAARLDAVAWTRLYAWRREARATHSSPTAPSS